MMIPVPPPHTNPCVTPLDVLQEPPYTPADRPFLLAGVLGSASAAGPDAVEALLGFDPVLLTEGKEVLGNDEISVSREWLRYHFANVENKAKRRLRDSPN